MSKGSVIKQRRAAAEADPVAYQNRRKEIARTVVERNLDLVRRIADSNLRPPRKLREMITALMNSYGEHYPLFYIYIRENLSHVSNERSEWSRHMKTINRQTTEAMISVIEEGFADGSFRKIKSARIVTYGIFGVIGWTHRWFRPDNCEASAEEIGRTYADMILYGLEMPY